MGAQTGKQRSAFHLFGLRVSAHASAWMAMLLLGAIWFAVALILQTGWQTAAMTALAAVILHWSSETVHCLGHAWAAAGVGYPMSGFRYWWMMAKTIYPKDEPTLPPEIHLRRALGGPIFSAGVTLAAGLLWWLFPGGIPAWNALLAFFFLDNLLFFTAQVLIPIPWADGGEIAKQLRALRSRSS
jgi:hypothetical protein